MSPAARDMMNNNHMLISQSCSNGLFTRCSITNLPGQFSYIKLLFLNRQLFKIPMLFFLSFPAMAEQLKKHLWSKTCFQRK